MGGQRRIADPQAAGWQALRNGDWPLARAHFERAIKTGETPEALEGIGWAAYCLDDDPLTFHARERAFQLYRQRGDHHAAARVAAWLAADWLEFRGEPAVANGWLQLARRLLDPLESGLGHGWLAVHEASMIVEEDAGAARELAAQAVEIGRRFAVPELEMVGLGLEGFALVSQGDLRAGMQRLDKATATALSGEAEILGCVSWACCCLIAACEQVRDYDRAGEWCRRMAEFCERHRIAFPLSVCKARYAGVLTWQGRWAEAEAELYLAAEGLTAGRPPRIGDALVRLADLRRQQGRLDEAEALFGRCEGMPLAVLGRAEVALSRGRAAEAAELADRYLRRFPDPNRIERCAGLEVKIRAQLSVGELAPAEQALAELADLASRTRTGPLRAAACAARGRIAAARGEHETARRCFEDALDLLAAANAPFESARVRLDLAAGLSAAGRHEAARREAQAARAVFRRLGARGEAARAEALLGGVNDPVTPPDPLARLSRREQQVLALVAEGLTNNDIAARLVVSEHTVHRHVTSILRKLGVPSRAAAASVAARHGLV